MSCSGQFGTLEAPITAPRIARATLLHTDGRLTTTENATKTVSIAPGGAFTADSKAAAHAAAAAAAAWLTGHSRRRWHVAGHAAARQPGAAAALRAEAEAEFKADRAKRPAVAANPSRRPNVAQCGLTDGASI